MTEGAKFYHMCYGEKYFTNLNIQQNEMIYLADGTEMKASGIDDCKLFCKAYEIHVGKECTIYICIP